VIYLADCPFRIPRFTHHSADLSAFLDSAFYFPHSAIPHFTNNPHRLPYGPLWIVTFLLGPCSRMFINLTYHPFFNTLTTTFHIVNLRYVSFFIKLLLYCIVSVSGRSWLLCSVWRLIFIRGFWHFMRKETSHAERQCVANRSIQGRHNYPRKFSKIFKMYENSFEVCTVCTVHSRHDH